jgi:hypothetical protein
MNNSDFIQLSCELAHNRVEEADTSYIIENKGGKMNYDTDYDCNYCEDKNCNNGECIEPIND